MVQLPAMKYILNKTIKFLPVFFSVLFFSEPASATQTHGGIEGVYAHQFGHLFFLVSMGILVFWLRERDLVKQKGWRFIQYSAIFFILWNFDTFLVHLLDEQLEIINVSKIDAALILVEASRGGRFIEAVYYAAKLDHLFCVPAMWFLYSGLKCLLKESDIDLQEERIQ
ncbi:MAG: hypothetical protein KKD47_02490 [Proteobacteria bacterium]|nr:hypothetical protein [Pseudomonadota bacterium]